MNKNEFNQRFCDQFEAVADSRYKSYLEYSEQCEISKQQELRKVFDKKVDKKIKALFTKNSIVSIRDNYRSPAEILMGGKINDIEIRVFVKVLKKDVKDYTSIVKRHDIEIDKNRMFNPCRRREALSKARRYVAGMVGSVAHMNNDEINDRLKKLLKSYLTQRNRCT